MTISFLKVPYTHLLKTLLTVVLFLLVADLTGIALAKTISTTPIIEITFQDELISAKLIDAPLIDVLQRVKEEFGFKAHFHGDLTELLTLSFTDIPLDKCLRLLTVNHSLSVASLPTTTEPPEQNEAKQIAEVWVISRSATSKTFNTTPAAPLRPPPVLTNDTVDVSEESPEQSADGELESVPLDQVLNNPNAEKSAQLKAIKNLVETGDSASVMAMAEFLGNEDKEVRQMLVDGISSVQNEESTQILGHVLQTDPEPEIRKTAVRALGKRKNDNDAQAFLEEARNDSDDEVKTLAEQLLTQ
jgi:hypothetical protein